ncbi:MAG: hypothetical protein QTN59_12110 [Candidatus Electrothrix communis]|nr:MAG: hypothetical protein QTN59_12110 [Candidatus Electrothrix communis]
MSGQQEIPEEFKLLLNEIGDEFERFLRPLVRTTDSPLYILRFLQQIGWNWQTLFGWSGEKSEFETFCRNLNSGALDDLAEALQHVINKKEDVIGSLDDFNDVYPKLHSVAEIFNDLFAHPNNSSGKTLANSLGLLQNIPNTTLEHSGKLIAAFTHDIAEHLLLRYLAGRMPTVFTFALLFGLLHEEKTKPLYLSDSPEDGEQPLRFPLYRLAVNYNTINYLASLLQKNPFDGVEWSSPEQFYTSIEQLLRSQFESIAETILRRGMGKLKISLSLSSLAISFPLWLPTSSSPIVIPLTEQENPPSSTSGDNENANIPNLTIDSDKWRLNWTEIENDEEVAILGNFLFLLTDKDSTSISFILDPDPPSAQPPNEPYIEFKICVALLLKFSEEVKNKITLSLALSSKPLDKRLSDELQLKLRLVGVGELIFPLPIPGLTGMKLGIDAPEAEALLNVTEKNLTFKVSAQGFSIYLPTEFFKKAERVQGESDDWKLLDEAPEISFRLQKNDETAELLEVQIGQDAGNGWPTIISLSLLPPPDGMALTVNIDGAIFIGLDDDPENGFKIELTEFTYDFSQNGSFASGLFIPGATVHLPKIIPALPVKTLSLQQVSLSDKGFSGKISVCFEKKTEVEEKEKLFGILAIQFYSLELEFKNNIPIEFNLQAAVKLPYFDEWVDIQIGIDENFTILFSIESLAPEGITLTQEELLSFTFRSASLRAEEQTLFLSLNAGLEPLLWNADGLEWPRLDVTGLSVEQEIPRSGKIPPPVFRFQEAWVDLKDLASLDLFGFHFELNRIGIGYVEETDRMWVDLTGSLHLIDQIPVGLGVEGFRLTWPRKIYEELGIDNIKPDNIPFEQIIKVAEKIEVKFEGVYLFFGIPQTAEFEGHIRFIKEAQKVGFAGDMALRLPTVGLAAEAGLMVGMNFAEPPYPFLYVYFGILLPTGIPLGQSGLALKGAKGMFGLNVTPDLEPEQNPYYDWYKRDQEGVHQTSKWRDQIQSIAFGAGITITTADGKMLGVQGLLVMVLPGPIIMIEGKALIFDGIFPGDGPLKALGYFDGNAMTVQLNIEAAMELIEGVIDVNAGIEAFFDFNKSDNWHIYLGKDEPGERRVYAKLLKMPLIGWLFQGNTYLMLDGAVRSRLGAYIAFEPPQLDLSIASVKMKAVLEAEGLMTLNPCQFNNKANLDNDEANLDAVLDIEAFGLSVIGVEASAQVTMEGANPLIVDAKIEVHVDLPVPDLEAIPIIGEAIESAIDWFEEKVADLPDIPAYIEFHIPFHWEHQQSPPIEPLIRDIAVESYFVRGGGSIIEHLKKHQRSHPVDTDAPKSLSVPLDSKPSILFDQYMNHKDGFLFAGYANGEEQRFASGKLFLKPLITKVTVSCLPKHEYDPKNQNWTEIAGTAGDAEKKLWGLYRPSQDEERKDGEKRFSAGRRLLTLFNCNAFDFTAHTVPMRIPASTPEQDQNGQLFSESFLHRNDYKLLVEEAEEQRCIDIKDFTQHYKKILKTGTKKKSHKFIRRGDIFLQQVIIAGVQFESPSLSFVLLRLVRKESKKQYLLTGASGNSHTACLHIRFPEPVSEVTLTFKKDRKYTYTTLKDAYIKIPTRYPGKPQPRKIEVPSNQCVEEVSSNLPLNPNSSGSVTVSGKIGFNCLEIKAKDGEKVELIKMCWTSTDEKKRAAVRKQENRNNKEVLALTEQPEFLFESNCYYKIEVAYSIESDKKTVKAFQQKSYFQTDGPPQDLSPYVKWLSFSQADTTHFYQDDFVIRFNRSYISRLYPDADNSNLNSDHFPHKLEAIIKDSSGNITGGYFHNWTKSQSSSLLPDEAEWYNQARSQLGLEINTPMDDILEIRNDLLLSNLTEFSRQDWLVETLDSRPGSKPKWSVSNNKVTVWPSLMQPIGAGSSGTVFVVGKKEWQDYHFHAQFKSVLTKGAKIGLVFLYQTVREHYRLQLVYTGFSVFLQLIKVKDGKESVLDHLKSAGKSVLTSFSRRDRSKLLVHGDVDIYVKSISGQLSINIITEQMQLKANDMFPASTSGEIGFYSSGVAATFDQVSIIDDGNALKPKEQYTLLITGGEGGRTLIRDSQKLGAHWLEDDKNTWIYKESLEDFELISKLMLKSTSDSISFLLRTPAKDLRTPKNTVFYKLNVKRADSLWDLTFSVNDNPGEPEHVLVSKEMSFTNLNLVPIRIRLIGNMLKVWMFEQLAIELELEDYAVSAPFIPIFPARENTASHGVRHATHRITDARTDLWRRRIGRISIQRKRHFPVVHNGRIKIVLSEGAKLDSIEIREAALLTKRFVTSAFASCRDLFSGIRQAGSPLVINNGSYGDDTFDVKKFSNTIEVLVRSQLKVSGLTANLLESEVLYYAKSLNREALEESKQELAYAEVIHDEMYCDFLNKARAGYLQVGNSIISYQIRYQCGKKSYLLGYLLKSPESLEPMYISEGSYDSIGRCQFTLTATAVDKNNNEEVLPIDWVSSADGSSVFIYQLKNDTENREKFATAMDGEGHRLNITYVRNHHDDEKNKKFGHLCDRPYLLHRSRSEDEIIQNVPL